jgi:uncharacterized protein YjeT (DUF2065 family)
MFRAAFVWLAYLAIEPHARRMWPHILVAWTRLRDGRWRDPLVGQALLAGVLSGTVMTVLSVLPETAGRVFGLAGAEPFLRSWSIGPGTTYIARFGATVLNGLFNAMGIVALLVVLRVAVRADRAVLAVAAAVGTIFFLSGVRPVALDVVQAVIMGIGTVVFLRRHGLLALVAGLTIYYLLVKTPWTFDLGKWFAWRPVLTVVLVAALAVWGFRNVLGKQSVFPAAALDG